MSSMTGTANRQKQGLDVRTIVTVGMLGAVAVVLMMLSFPLPFAPSFYKIDLSEVPVLIGTFAMGPVAGIFIELVKILLNFLINGTQTAGVGELANFIIGISLVLPAGLIYKKNKTRKSALIGMVCGTVCMAIIGLFINALVLLPAYGAAFHMSIDDLVAMGTAIFPVIKNRWTFCLLCVVPFNLVKGIVVSIVTMLLYKRISPLLKGNRA